MRLKQYLSIAYVNPEPMLSMMIVRTINCNGVMLISTLNNKKFRDWRALQSNGRCLKVHIACDIERQCAETLQEEPKLKIRFVPVEAWS